MLLGDADEIVQYLCQRLGKAWSLPPALVDAAAPLQVSSRTPQDTITSSSSLTSVAKEKINRKGSQTPPVTTCSSSTNGATANNGKKIDEKMKMKAPVVAERQIEEPARIGARYVRYVLWIFFAFRFLHVCFRILQPSFFSLFNLELGRL